MTLSKSNIPTYVARGRGGAGREYRSHAGYPSAPSTLARNAISPTQLTPQRQRLIFILLVICTVMRVGTLRKISEAAQCSAKDLEVCHPGILVTY